MAKRPVPLYDFAAFGQAIKAARTGRNESRKKVSDEMNISPRYLANIENKGQQPSLQIFYELVTRYDISVMAPIRISFIHSLIASSMLCISLYPLILTEQPGKQRYKGHADKGNTAPGH